MNERHVWCARSMRMRCAALLFSAACASADPSHEREPEGARDARQEPALDAAAPLGPRGGDTLDASRAAQATGADAGARADASRPVYAGGEDAGSAPVQGFDAGSGASGATSCFGRCGADALLAIAGACACDVACLARGDCCADKHEWCAVGERGPICALTAPDVDPADCGSDLGWTFPHQGQLEILFGDTYDADCNVPLLYDDAQGRLPIARPSVVPERPPTEPISCGRLIDLDKQQMGDRDTFAPMRLFEDGEALSSWLMETPLTGFSDGPQAYTLFRRGADLSAPIYLAVRDADAAPMLPPRTAYRVLRQYATQHFQNTTATGVAHFDPEQPSARDDHEGTQTLFLWGRDQFAGASARALYLAYQPLPIEDVEGAVRWAPRYFAGLEASTPTWSPEESAAKPLFVDDFPLVEQLEVAWIPELEHWIMLYGGDVADGLVSAPREQPRRGAIHMRMAEHPWGPWTRATPVFWREHAAAFLRCDAPEQPPAGLPSGCDLDELPDDPEHSYDPGNWGPELRDFVGCVREAPVPHSPAFVPDTPLPCVGDQRGNLYAPNLLVSWTVDRRGEHGYAHAATLYFNVSTWAPYKVILAALTIYLP